MQAIVTTAILLMLSACTALAPHIPRVRSETLPHPEQTSLGRVYEGESSIHPGESGIHLLDVGTDALLARAALADAAERSIDLQYYSLRGGRTTRLLTAHLVAAAERGVRVRLLLDGLDAGGRNREIGAMLANPRIEVRLFNPFLRQTGPAFSRLIEFLGESQRLNRRMHNKLWIADGVGAIVGGRNLGDEYFDSRPDINFTDLDVLVIGPVVPQLSRSFDEYWNSKWSVAMETFESEAPVPESVDRPPDAVTSAPATIRETESDRLGSGDFFHQLTSGTLPMTWASAHAVYDLPAKIGVEEHDDVATHMGPHLRDIVASAQSELSIISPYFIPGTAGQALLGALSGRGVRVNVLTNSLASTDVPLVHFGYAPYRVELLKDGVQLYEMRPADGRRAPHETRLFARRTASSLHAKAFIVDRRTTFVGSMNFDPRSRHLNTELGIVIESPAFADELSRGFEEAFLPRHAFQVLLDDESEAPGSLVWITREDGKDVRYHDEPLVGILKRWWLRVLSTVVPEDAL